MLRLFKAISGPYLNVRRQRWALFQICGSAGMLLALAMAAVLTVRSSLSIGVMGATAFAAVLTFFVLAMGTKIATGEERLIYYHQEIAVLLVVASLLWAMRQPLLPYLDATILGIGLSLSFGRIGCLMVGCCHGRPHCWGIRYMEEHAAAGFPSGLVGVRLFPIQAVESLWVLGTVVAGTYFVWSGRQPGTALAWYVVTYDAGRFAFEFARGDDRPYWLGFSQPQWLSLVLTGGVVWAERAGRLPLSRWHLATFASLIAIMVAVAFKRRFQRTPTFRLLHPRHIQQIASGLKSLEIRADSASRPHETSAIIPIVCTSLGIQISGSRIDCETQRVYHYTLSNSREPMTESAARILAGLVRKLNAASGSEKLVAGIEGVFHFLICVPAVTNL